MRQRALSLLCLTFATVAPAWSDDAQPTLQANLQTFLQFDATSQPHSDTLTNLYATAYGSGVVRASDWLSFDFLATFEPITDAVDDRVLQNHGLYLNALEANLARGPLSLSAGKFSPNFGLGFLLTPGMNWDTFNGDVEIWGRIGLRGSYNLTEEGSAAGLILSAGLFRRDTSLLSDSAFYQRGRLRVADGSPGNHDGLQSFSVGADWIAPAWAPGLHAHAGYLHQQTGLGDATDAQGWVASVNWTCDAEGSSYQLIGEWAQSIDSIGFGDPVSAPGASQRILTAGAAWKAGSEWTGSLVLGQRHTHNLSAADTDAWFSQLTVGRYLSDEISLEAGWQKLDDGAAVSDTVSLRLVGVFDYALE